MGAAAAAWAGVGIAAIGTAKSMSSSGGGGGGGGRGGPPPVPKFGEGPFWGGFQRATLSGLPSAAIRQRELEFGQADWGGEALQSLRAARPGLMPAPGEDVFRGDLYNAGQDINTLEGARNAFRASMERYGEFGERAQGRGAMALGTERIARPMVEQGLATPFALGSQTESLFDQRAAGRRNLLLIEQARAAAGLRERLAGRFGPGYQSGSPFLAGEEEYVTRPYAQGLTQLGISDVEQRLGAAQWQRGYERNILEDSVKAQSLAARDELQAGKQSDLMASELEQSGFDMAKLRSDDAMRRMLFLQKAQFEMPNLMETPLDSLKDIRTIQGGPGGGSPTFQTRPSSDWGRDLMGLGGDILGMSLAERRHRERLGLNVNDPTPPMYTSTSPGPLGRGESEFTDWGSPVEGYGYDDPGQFDYTTTGWGTQPPGYQQAVGSSGNYWTAPGQTAIPVDVGMY